MTTNKPEVVAWYTPATRGTLPVVALNDRSQRGEPLIRLSDYQRLQAECEKLRKYLQMLIDQTTPLVPDPDRPEWSRRIELDEVMAERDSLRDECEKLVETLREIATWPDGGSTYGQEKIKAFANATLEAHYKGVKT